MPRNISPFCLISVCMTVSVPIRVAADGTVSSFYGWVILPVHVCTTSSLGFSPLPTEIWVGASCLGSVVSILNQRFGRTQYAYITSAVCVLTISRKISRAYLSYRGREDLPILSHFLLWGFSCSFSGWCLCGSLPWLPICSLNLFMIGCSPCPFLSVLCPCVEEFVCLFVFPSIRMLSRHRCFLSDLGHYLSRYSHP